MLIMSDLRRIKSALISVYHKDRLDDIVKTLHDLDVDLYSTGGTRDFIAGLGIPVTAVEDVTSYPSIFGGRVKTLHPKIFGGILYRREMKEDLAQAAEYDIPAIDLVIVDLYPFEETVAAGASDADIIEKIDIGGISLIRAAAKNFQDVVIVPSKREYLPLLNLLKEKGGETSLEDRKRFAAAAFEVSSHYDSAIFNYFNADGIMPAFKCSLSGEKPLRYGENPHQHGAFYGAFDELFTQLHGKEISYNNLVDIDAAVSLIADFNEAPTFAILKHNNACGVASDDVLVEAWKKALAGDPVSAFGGVFIANRPIDAATATEINALFFEILIAPGFSDEALQILEVKKNRILLLQKGFPGGKMQFRSLLNGVVVQEKDLHTETPEELRTVTDLAPTEAQVADLLFANRLVKHTKSNAIVLVKDRQLLGSGMGQTSRVDALRQAIEKARRFNFDLNGAVMSSDAYFPFPDCVAIAHEAGITAVVHPGGSIRDGESIDYCNQHQMAMVCTGIRHFKH